MRLLVCGSRTWDDARRFCREMDALMPDVVIHGACPFGADDMAQLWGAVCGRRVERYEADWSTHGRAAGPRRNAKMLADGKPDRGLAFGHTGTGDMVHRMLLAGLPVRWIAAPDALAVDLDAMPAMGGGVVSVQAFRYVDASKGVG